MIENIKIAAMVFGGLVGGRLLFVAINWKFYALHPLSVFNLSEGGMAFQGALFVSVAFGELVCAGKKISFWKVVDILAPYLALAHSIGRIGCFLNGCCYGKAACCFPGVIFPGDDVYRIPTQIYSSAGLLAIFVFLIWLRAKKKFDGHLFSVYLMSYSLFRCFMDNFRGDELVRVNGYTLSQVLSAVIFLFGACVYLTRRKKCVVK